MYEEDANLFLRLPDELAGEIVKAISNTFLTGEKAEYDDPFKAAVYSAFVDKLEMNLAAYVATCEKNAQNAQARKKKEAPKNNKNAQKQPKVESEKTQNQPNVNENVNVNANAGGFDLDAFQQAAAHLVYRKKGSYE